MGRWMDAYSSLSGDCRPPTEPGPTLHPHHTTTGLHRALSPSDRAMSETFLALSSHPPLRTCQTQTQTKRRKTHRGTSEC